VLAAHPPLLTAQVSVETLLKACLNCALKTATINASEQSVECPWVRMGVRQKITNLNNQLKFGR
jgi:hypothetical protein